MSAKKAKRKRKTKPFDIVIKDKWFKNQLVNSIIASEVSGVKLNSKMEFYDNLYS